MTPHYRLVCLLGLLATMALSAIPSPASAWIQTQTCYRGSGPFPCANGEEPRMVSWPQRAIRYHLHERGTAQLPLGSDGRMGEALRKATLDSFEVWNAPACSDLQLSFAGLTPRDVVEYNSSDDPGANTNLVVWRDDDWPYNSYAAIALTTVIFRPSTGEIVDADIELNSEMFRFTNSESAPPNGMDVRNTLTHEVGHFIGLDHSLEPAATMYATAPEGETSKRDLHPDDIEGLCRVYPPRCEQLANLQEFASSAERQAFLRDCEQGGQGTGGSEPKREDDDNSWCALGQGAAPMAPWWVLAGLGAARLHQRLRRRRVR